MKLGSSGRQTESCTTTTMKRNKKKKRFSLSPLNFPSLSVGCSENSAYFPSPLTLLELEYFFLCASRKLLRVNGVLVEFIKIQESSTH